MYWGPLPLPHVFVGASFTDEHTQDLPGPGNTRARTGLLASCLHVIALLTLSTWKLFHKQSDKQTKYQNSLKMYCFRANVGANTNWEQNKSEYAGLGGVTWTIPLFICRRLSQRPTPEELEQRNILQRESSYGYKVVLFFVYFWL